MEAFKEHVGLAAPLNRLNVDTDQIIPKQFLNGLNAPVLGSSCFTTGVLWIMVIPIRTLS